MLPQLSLAHAHPAALLVQEGLIRSSLPWELKAQSEQHQLVPFSSPLCWSSPADPQRGGEEGAGPIALLHQNPSSLLNSIAAGSIGSVTHDENRCYSSSAGA